EDGIRDFHVTGVQTCALPIFTVDGDTSTNDMACVMANGLAENDEITSREDPGYSIFKEKLGELMTYLAKLIVSDGEGASKFIERSEERRVGRERRRRL